ncbi:MAG: pyridoxamine 5'-phosphate oxidase family protein [Candidatus Amesbacteria bacterium]|nr:pyridoxamine 5'-phosphate oxidase family protein [Candidatus Amesbacteria bacterium]
MNKDKLTQVAKEIIKSNCYLTLGTAIDSQPWVAPLFYAVDDKNIFYYISQLDSLHTKHILKNPNVSFAIFDSHQKEGTGNGVQGSGRAYLLEDSELLKAFKWYHTTYIEMKSKLFKAPAPYRFFKIIPEHFYILDSDAPTDKRVEVKL